MYSMQCLHALSELFITVLTVHALQALSAYTSVFTSDCVMFSETVSPVPAQLMAAIQCTPHCWPE